VPLRQTGVDTTPDDASARQPVSRLSDVVVPFRFLLSDPGHSRIGRSSWQPLAF
jgi:hypothetical protein